MALANKLGGLLKKATSLNPSLFQAIRCMSSAKLFVGGLSYGMDEQSLGDAFANYGVVTEVKIINDRDTGRSRGFGFVTFSSSDDAKTAIMALDGKDLHGRIIRVNHATERTSSFRGGGGYGGGGGGYGGGGGAGYGSNYGNRDGGYGDYGGAGGSGGNDSFAGSNFAAGGSRGEDTFAGSNFTPGGVHNFGGDRDFGGNPVGNFGAAGGSTGGDELSRGAPGDNFEGGKNDDLLDMDLKDDEPDNYANKRG